MPQEPFWHTFTIELKEWNQPLHKAVTSPPKDPLPMSLCAKECVGDPVEILLRIGIRGIMSGPQPLIIPSKLK